MNNIDSEDTKYNSKSSLNNLDFNNEFDINNIPGIKDSLSDNLNSDQEITNSLSTPKMSLASNNTDSNNQAENSKYKNNILNYYFNNKKNPNENKPANLTINRNNNKLNNNNNNRVESFKSLYNNYNIDDNNEDVLNNNIDIYKDSMTTDEFYKELRKTNISIQSLNLLTDNKYRIQSPSKKPPHNLPPIQNDYNKLYLNTDVNDEAFLPNTMRSNSNLYQNGNKNYSVPVDEKPLNNGSFYLF